ncbi:phosphoribosylanthranilate isomerase [Monaibacterium marinum]|uniref:N-(5'-phosphoribosyl)anthranilate isomerase n=1 Tax=Pontivivens marinum TaxID=1690039 RepID=A0A2C9CN53_9RHOB|nr:phosphoribosylanthranilate isomerase [Monaibacterium marinum]SOH92637.1 phosphoribosylanthranilate isomerase [Monaibacterium marinum]
MTTAIRAKICGLTTVDSVAAAVNAGAAYVGFVFFPKSPRNISIELARELAADVPPGVCKVALVVDADNETLDAINDAVPLDMLQLHGNETPERVAEIRARYGLPVMKAVGIRGAEDLEQIDIYAEVADQLLIDAKPPKGADLPGGNGVAFDWSLLSGRRWPTPWMLAGGLTPDNALRAANLTGANQLDVSSGVESAAGVKDLDKIDRFIAQLGPMPPRLV